jgi:hypothetical protein
MPTIDYGVFTWPAVGANPSVGNNGAAIPLFSTLIGGSDGTDLIPLSVSGSGVLNVAASSLPLPTGAATSANQTNGSQKTQVVDGSGNVIGSTSNALDVQIKNSSIAATQSGTWNINDISGTISLPTGAATYAAQTNGTQKNQIVGSGGNIANVDIVSGTLLGTEYGIVTNTVVHGHYTSGGGGYADLKCTASGVLLVDASGTTVPVSGTVAATQSGTWNVGLNAGSNLVGKIGIDQTTPGTTNAVSLAQIGSTTMATGNGVVGTGVQRVAIASDNTAFGVNAAQSGTWNIGTLTSITNAVTVTGTVAATQSGTWTVQPGNTVNTTAWLITQDGRSKANSSAYNDYTSTNVTTSAYTQLVASLTSACNEIEIFDSSGQGMILATGAAGAEVDQIFIFPGGNGRVPLKIAASTRVSIKAKTATASVGYIMINFYA